MTASKERASKVLQNLIVEPIGLSQKLVRVPYNSVFSFLTLFLFANASYFFFIFGSIENVLSCCDALGYLRLGDRVFSDGLLFENQLSGYRHVMNYVAIGGVVRVGDLLGRILDQEFTRAAAYAVGSILLYSGSAIILVGLHWRKDGFKQIFSAIYLNPLSLALVVFPLQESQLVLLLGPLIVLVVVYLRTASWNKATALLCLFLGVAYLVKSSLLLIVLPVLGLIIYIVSKKKVSLSIPAASLLLAAMLTAPQSYVTFHKFGTLYPYPDASVLGDQLVWGYTAWHYSTILEGDGLGRFAKNDFTPISNTSDYLQRMEIAPLEVVSLWVGHVFSAFNYSQVKVYISDPLPAFAPFNVLSGTILFLGCITWLGVLQSGRYHLEDFFLDSVFFGAAAVLPLIAVESRFSYLPAIVLTYRFAQWASKWNENDRRIQDSGGAILFGFLFAFCMLLVDTAGGSFQ